LRDQTRAWFHAREHALFTDWNAVSPSAPAQPGIAADRFAREIAGFLKASASALAAAECQPVRRPGRVVGTPFFDLIRRLRSRNTRYAGGVMPVRVGQGVGGRLVMLIARSAGCGTHARCADCPFWAG
jgi:hypothetical protein